MKWKEVSFLKNPTSLVATILHNACISKILAGDRTNAQKVTSFFLLPLTLCCTCTARAQGNSWLAEIAWFLWGGKVFCGTEERKRPMGLSSFFLYFLPVIYTINHIEKKRASARSLGQHMKTTEKQLSMSSASNIACDTPHIVRHEKKMYTHAYDHWITQSTS
mgnify:CR=1 FL=1